MKPHGSYLGPATFVLLTILGFSVAGPSVVHETCIIGAGPGGIQLGHLLLQAGRSFRMFERNAEAGAFFSRYPVHRRLISVNTANTGSDDAEFNMRHDWNSLLDNDEVPKMTARTRDRWPLAGMVQEYLADFAQAQVDAGMVAFNTSVDRVYRAPHDAMKGAKFQLEVSGAEVGTVLCEDLVVATGLPISKPLPSYGEDLVYGYENLPSVETFRGQHVAVLGNGNAAFETAEWLSNEAYVSVLHRQRELDWPSPFERNQAATGTRMAMMTHYVGDVRAGRLPIFDAYHLKMRDRIIRFESDDTIIVYRCHTTKLCVTAMEHEETPESTHIQIQIDPAELNALENAVTSYSVKFPECADKLSISRVSFEYAEGDPERGKVPVEKVQENLRKLRVNASRFEFEHLVFRVALDVLIADKEFFTFFSERVGDNSIDQPFGLEGAGIQVTVVDSVVRCYGWKMDTSIFDKGLKPKSVIKGKYPKINQLYRAQSGIYFIGALAHSLDFRLSAGGFIHGYRYSSRALFRYLEDTRHGVPWPRKVFPGVTSKGGREQLLRHTLYRIDHAAGPYQMFGGTLLEGIVFRGICEEGGRFEVQAEYYDELPPAYFHEKFKNDVRVAWWFEYGPGFHGPKTLYGGNDGASSPERAHDSTFLHPRLQAYAPDGRGASAEVMSRHFMLEDLNFRFSKATSHVLPLRNFFLEVISQLREANVCATTATVCDGNESETCS